ncbi:MAG: YibE/F family protein [Actinomycetota bacterium]|nr:YibE/F family protein [Actinomycetota bacterium]
MSDSHSDFHKLLGPDRRKVPTPSGLGGVVVAIAVLVVVGLVALWPSDQHEIDLATFGFADDVVTASVAAVDVVGCSYDPSLSCSLNTFRITQEDSVDLGLLVDLELPDEAGQPEFNVGDPIFMFAVDRDDGSFSYQYMDRDRRGLIAVLTAVFALAVILLGRFRGLAALVGLVLSIAILFLFILPAIITGTDAVLVALVGGGAISLVSLYLAHGYNPLTHVATLGVFSALVLTTGLSWLVVRLAAFSGLVTEEAFYLLAIPDLDLNGLLLAGIVLGAIGALDDVTVTQASAVWEVRKANPSIDASDLYASGLRIGRDHIVSTVNTLLLAYAGASLPLLILFTLSAQPLGVVASTEVVALEIVRTLVGSIGLVAAVPLTTWLGARVVHRLNLE